MNSAAGLLQLGMQCRDADELQSLVLAAIQFSEQSLPQSGQLGNQAASATTKSVGQSGVAQRPESHGKSKITERGFALTIQDLC